MGFQATVAGCGLTHKLALVIKSTHIVAHIQDIGELGSHWVMLHGHKQRVEYNTDCDGQVYKWIHHY